MTYPDAFRPPVLGLVFTALLKFSPAFELDHPPSPLPDDSTGADAGADDAVGLAQSGSPYWPLIVQYSCPFDTAFSVVVSRVLLFSGSGEAPLGKVK